MLVFFFVKSNLLPEVPIFNRIIRQANLCRYVDHNEESEMILVYSCSYKLQCDLIKTGQSWF